MLPLITDGNGRWQRKGLPRTAGHQAGLKRVRQITEESAQLGIKILTLYASHGKLATTGGRSQFSDGPLPDSGERDRATAQQRVRINFIGLPDRLAPRLLKLMAECAAKTRENDRITLNLAINYGGRLEIINAVQKLVGKRPARDQPGRGTPELFGEYLYRGTTRSGHEIIRTSGNSGSCNFLLWQGTYANYSSLSRHYGFLILTGRNCTNCSLSKRRSRRFGGLEEGGGT